MVNAETISKLSTVLKPIHTEQNENAAVALILKVAKGDHEILLVKRAISKRDVWSGQIALPGGKRESQDATLKDTITRETMEETGIYLGANCFRGVLGAVRSVPKPDFLVLPFVAVSDEELKVQLNSCELTSYIWVPYEEIVQSSTKTNLPHVGEVPAFLLSNTIVWGMTHRILSEFIHKVETLKTQ